MFQVVLVMSNTTANLSMCFKTEDKAKEALEAITPDIGVDKPISSNDDFGNEFRTNGRSISYALFIDVAKSQWREYELDTCVQKTRQVLQKRMISQQKPAIVV